MSVRPISLAELERVANAASPGPWPITEDSANGKEEAWCYWHRVGPIDLPGDKPGANSLHIAAASPDVVLRLVAALRDAHGSTLGSALERTEFYERHGITDAPECSICRRRHGAEIVHAHE